VRVFSGSTAPPPRTVDPKAPPCPFHSGTGRDAWLCDGVRSRHWLRWRESSVWVGSCGCPEVVGDSSTWQNQSFPKRAVVWDCSADKNRAYDLLVLYMAINAALQVATKISSIW